MPEQEDPDLRALALQPLQLGTRLLGTKRVLGGIVERAVSKCDGPGYICPERESLEVGAGVGVENASRPFQALACERNALCIAEPPERNEIVVPGDADGIQRGHCSDALIRKRPVADEVARDHVAVDACPLEVCERRLECRQIPVDVGEDSVAHL
jgi:hypothetical protein